MSAFAFLVSQSSLNQEFFLI